VKRTENDAFMVTYDQYLKNFDDCVSSYIPPENLWTPADEALYKPKDLYRISVKDAEELQLKSIKFAFKHHYEKNKFYHDFCKEHNVGPNDIKNNSDMLKIPLIPDGFYKDYPHGKDFATWLGNIYTGELPKIVIPHTLPNYDQVIDSFSKAGVIVTYSSGTGGRHTFIPRDIRTFQASEYALAKSVVSMIYPFWEYESSGYILMPNPKKNFIYAGKALEIYMDAVKNMNVAIDRHINTETIRITMGIGRGLRSKLIRFGSKRVSKKMIDEIISWLEKNKNTNEKISMIGAPFILYFVMKKIQDRGLEFDFGERGAVVTGGGWKIHEQIRMTSTSFRKIVKDVLGIPEKFCLDAYGMVEGNGWMVQCPEGHYLHLPYSYFKPIVLDDEFNQIGFGETGRFAFLDAIAMSYPGFITTGDKVKLLEHCPVCDRPGPVLDPEVKRVKGAEIRGCAEEMRSMMTRDIGR
jgi:hypothetical protein